MVHRGPFSPFHLLYIAIHNLWDDSLFEQFDIPINEDVF